MFKALGDYFISSQGSTFPVNVYNPQQLFGDKLTVWYDFNDQSTLFSDTGFTTTVTNNQNIKGIRNKGTGNGRNYDMYDDNGDGTPISGGSIWKENYINTNKNLSLKSGLGRYRSFSALTVNDSASAMTYSVVYKAPTTSSNLYPISCSNQGFRQMLYLNINTTSNLYTINIQNNGGGGIGPLASVSVTIPAFTDLKYNIATFTVDSTGTLNFYHNDNLILTTTGITGNLPLFPLVPSSLTSPIRINFSVGGSSQVNSTDGVEILEMILSDGVCLTPDQVNKLNQYFKLKFNI